MPDKTPAQEFVAVFRAGLQDTLIPRIEETLAEQKRSEDAMLQRNKGYSMAGMSWASSSFSISANHDRIHFNMPSVLATDENLELVENAITAAEEATGLSLDGRRVKGGSNFVIDGRLEEKPAFKL